MMVYSRALNKITRHGPLLVEKVDDRGDRRSLEMKEDSENVF